MEILTIIIILLLIYLIYNRLVRIESYQASGELQFVNSKYKAMLNKVKNGLPKSSAKPLFDKMFNRAEELILGDDDKSNTAARTTELNRIKSQRLGSFNKLFTLKGEALNTEIQEQIVKYKLV